MVRETCDTVCMSKLEKIVRDFPSMICLQFPESTRMLAFHGAIHKSKVRRLEKGILKGLGEVSLHQPVSVALGEKTCDSIEWCDYSISDTKSKRSMRKSVSRKSTDLLLKNTECILTQGGHQDLIECIGLVGDRNISGDKNFHISPFYKKNADLYVFKDFCNLKNDACTNVRTDKTREIVVTRENPTILKTSIAYNCKTSVNGTSYIECTESKKGEFVLNCNVFEKKEGRYDKHYQADDWSSLNSWTWKTFQNHVDALPLVMIDHVDVAYRNPNYKTVGREALSEMMSKYNPYNAKDCVMVYQVPRNSRVISIGDIHSNIHGFCDVLEKLESEKLFHDFKLHPNIILLLLGDYGDRGPYGLLVHWLILKLRHENPASFLVIRGNHETSHLWRGTGMEEEFYDMED